MQPRLKDDILLSLISIGFYAWLTMLPDLIYEVEYRDVIRRTRRWIHHATRDKEQDR